MPISLAVEPMVMTYIPDAHLLHTGEMIQPLGPNGSLLYPESLLEVRDSVLSARLQVDRLIRHAHEPHGLVRSGSCDPRCWSIAPKHFVEVRSRLSSLRLERLGRRFETLLDCGLFHTLVKIGALEPCIFETKGGVQNAQF